MVIHDPRTKDETFRNKSHIVSLRFAIRKLASGDIVWRVLSQGSDTHPAGSFLRVTSCVFSVFGRVAVT